MVIHIFGGLLSEAWARSISSYTRSLEAYNTRLRDGIQPSTPFLNVFDVDRNLVVLCIGNSLYIFITMSLFLYMKKREKGFQLRWLLVIYDAFNVILSSYIAVSTLRYKLSSAGLLLCNPIATDTAGYRISKVFVLFYFQKYVEFIDTWFFILRKSSRQVTFLHLFHHSSITVVVGSIMPFDYNGDMYLPILLNSLNHALVYLHYLLATLGLQSWWAPYITSMQLAQFIIIFAQSLLSYRIGPTCGSPDFAKVLMILYMGSMVALFGNFFLQRYVLRRPSTDTDMCGVIKRPQPQTMLISTSQFCGVSKLNAHGSCVVLLPPDFPDLVWALEPQSNCPYAPFTVAYNISAVGAAMPELHVSTEITRFNASLLKLQHPSQPHVVKKRREEKGQEKVKEKVKEQSVATAPTNCESSSRAERPRPSAGGGAGSSSSSSSSSIPAGSAGVHRRAGATTAITPAGHDDSDIDSRIEERTGNVTIAVAGGTSQAISAAEYAILKSYWESNAAAAAGSVGVGRGNHSTSSNAAGGGGELDSARFGRSVSTGSLPSTNAARSAAVHNDRLIDSLLTQSVLGGLRRVRSSEWARLGLVGLDGDSSQQAAPGSAASIRSSTSNPSAICQLDRGEANDADIIDTTTTIATPLSSSAVAAANASATTERSEGLAAAQTKASRVSGLAGLVGYVSHSLSLLLGGNIGRTWRQGSVRSAAAGAGAGAPPSVSANSSSDSLTTCAATANDRGRSAQRIGPIPLCFVVSGGKAGCRVSWMVTVLPSPPHIHTHHHSQSQGTGNASDDSSDNDSQAVSQQDWRAIFK